MVHGEMVFLVFGFGGKWFVRFWMVLVGLVFGGKCLFLLVLVLVWGL